MRARRAAPATTLASGLLAAALALSACSGAAPPPATGPGSSRPAASASTSAAPSASAAASTSAGSGASSGSTPTPSRPATPPDPASVPAQIASRYEGGNLRLGRERGSTDAYRQYYATYESNGLTISGRINIPRGTGPFPAIVLAHGYVDPAEYTNGETMLRERDFLARQGYVTLHIDYRNHAQSDRDPTNDADLRAGYTADAINAALALKKAQVVDPDRIALVGRSMGGGVVYSALVVRPGLFRAAVAYSPVSSDTVDNFDRWVRRDADRSGVARRVIARLGTPEAEPARWATTSPRTSFARITEPLLIHHGTADEDCPIAWSAATVRALRADGKDVTYFVYPGQRHTFTSQWPLSIRRTTAFLDAHLR
ncbi:alpha/beta hydrolase family protein [Intrasporangium flavum]|uniref:alpha/beta hydrolase family protein n=1 Tax=Intrasporangium flavum TaxID=1428657 RepID=UPI00096C6177|nr:alpha/beta fold hydrolase [Intrasporangium flavum]